MPQNTSTAVMQRRVEPHDSLDDFPTPPWATRALFKHVLTENEWDEVLPPEQRFAGMTCWEPACNRGYMARPLQEYFGRVYRTDVHDYSAEYNDQEGVCDFLMLGCEPLIIQEKGFDWVITNPPFRLAEQFALQALSEARVGVALFVRSAFLEGSGRHRRLFSEHPPAIVAQFCERVPLLKGRYDPKGSTATAYCWLVWIRGKEGTRFVWIPKCRKELERPTDAQG